MDLYVASMQAIKALELCLEYNIKIDEDMAEKLSGENAQALQTDQGWLMTTTSLFQKYFFIFFWFNLMFVSFLHISLFFIFRSKVGGAESDC